MSHRIFKLQAKALIRLRICAGWSETLLVAHTTLLEISCRGSYISTHKSITNNAKDKKSIVFTQNILTPSLPIILQSSPRHTYPKFWLTSFYNDIDVMTNSVNSNQVLKNTGLIWMVRIYHEYEGRIEKSVLRITVWHHNADFSILPSQE